MHCTACPCPLHFIVQLPHDKCAPSGKSNRSRSRSHSRSRSQLRVEVEIKAKKKPKRFDCEYCAKFGSFAKVDRAERGAAIDQKERKKSVLCFGQTTVNIVYPANQSANIKSFFYFFKNKVYCRRMYKYIIYTEYTIVNQENMYELG